jgi:hypothetical protein
VAVSIEGRPARGPADARVSVVEFTDYQAPGGFVRFKNRYRNTYPHTERGPLEAGSIQEGWWSAMWQVSAGARRGGPDGAHLEAAGPVLVAVARGPMCRALDAAPAATVAVAPPGCTADGACPVRPADPAGRLTRAWQAIFGGD